MSNNVTEETERDIKEEVIDISPEQEEQIRQICEETGMTREAFITFSIKLGIMFRTWGKDKSPSEIMTMFRTGAKK